MEVGRKDLLDKLKKLSLGLSQREIIEQASCFVIKDGMIHSFNDEISCRCPCELKMDGAFNANTLLAILGRMDEKKIDIECVDENIVIQGKKKKVRIVLNKEVLLAIDSVEMPKKWRKLPEEFVKAISLARQCVSRDESQFIVTCVHIHKDWIEACDDFQAIRYTMSTGFDSSILVRGDSIKGILDLDIKEFGETEHWVHFRDGSGFIMSCKRYMEKYPDTSKIFEIEGVPMKLPEGLSEAAKRAQVFSNDGSNESLLTLSLKEGKLKITGKGVTGWYDEIKEVEYEGQPISLFISPSILMDIFSYGRKCEVSKDRLKIRRKNYTYVAVASKE